eukprot:TRINITY_DN1746_c2_g1_i1.p1 TRINITY_DN1746_c2_g1~~TRINITY_DN1746_c2_g1_i1.p1  ORF type:complete len:460 (-),score=81.24 TRINITY_DN1746_c2_g1_i1:270-1649(-)
MLISTLRRCSLPFAESHLRPRVSFSKTTLLKNCLIWTGETDPFRHGAPRPAFPGSILIRGNTIEAVFPDNEPVPSLEGASIVDCKGYSVVPGLVEGHAHVSFEEVAAMTDPGDLPPEEGVLVTLRNCQRLLDAGFTSAFSAASARMRLDVVARNWINEGQAPGPRLLAASPEICATGCLGDGSALHQHRDSFGLVADGPDAVQQAVRLCIREGVDTIKINIGGDLIPTNMLNKDKTDVLTTYSSPEVSVAVQESHRREKRVAAHCRGSGDVTLALEHGVDVIYHCDFVHQHQEILDALEAAKDRIFIGPAVGLMDGLSPGGIFAPSDSAGIPDVAVLLEAQCKTYRELHQRGLRIVLGGDYGFRVTPQGTNANDLILFQQHFGFSAEEALLCGTKYGGELMGFKVGQLRKGWLADVLVVEGKPWMNSEPLLATRTAEGNVKASAIKAIIQDGFFHKDEL